MDMENEQLSLSIIGAPRCGTTSLHSWLSKHPRISGSIPKETNYFIDESHPLSSRTAGSHVQLSQFFKNDIGDQKRLESTPYNFRQHRALELFSSMQPKPLIIVILRNPTERLLSAFRFARDYLGTIEKDYLFSEYVDDLLDGRSTQKMIHRFSRYVDFLIATDGLSIGRYVEWLEPWLNRFSKEKLAIYDFPTLRDYPSEITNDICRRLEISSGFYKDFVFSGLNESVKAGRNFVSEEELSEPLQRLRDYYRESNRLLKQKFGLQLTSEGEQIF